MNHVAKLMTADVPLPAGAELLGWIDRHPQDDHGPGYAVLRFTATGIESAWNGAAVRALPRDWRERCTLTPAEGSR